MNLFETEVFYVQCPACSHIFTYLCFDPSFPSSCLSNTLGGASQHIEWIPGKPNELFYNEYRLKSVDLFRAPCALRQKMGPDFCINKTNQILLFIVSFIRQCNKWDFIFVTSMYLIFYGYGFIGLVYYFIYGFQFQLAWSYKQLKDIFHF